MIDVRSNFLAVRSLRSSKKRTEEIKYKRAQDRGRNEKHDLRTSLHCKSEWQANGIHNNRRSNCQSPSGNTCWLCRSEHDQATLLVFVPIQPCDRHEMRELPKEKDCKE